jgi:molecular chaperone Hsp33
MGVIKRQPDAKCGIIILMTVDRFHPALFREANLAIGVANTTRLCRFAQQSHRLASTSAIALGRLMTAAAMTGLLREANGTVSLQVICEGRLGHLYADITPDGDVRGFVRNTDMDMPLLPGESPDARRSIAAAVGAGQLSVIRMPPDREFTQSTTPLISGELDVDVEHFLTASDQIPTMLVCDVLVDVDGQITHAGGMIMQGLPGADIERLESIRRSVVDVGFASLLATHVCQPPEMLKAIVPRAQPIDRTTKLCWRCRCSYERVLASLRLFGAVQLAEMIGDNVPTQVNCDFCGKVYAVPIKDIRKVYQSLISSGN